MNKKPLGKRTAQPVAGAAGKTLKDDLLPRRHTGRMLVRLDPKLTVAAVLRQAKAGGLVLTTMQDWGSGPGVEGGPGGALEKYDGVIFEKLKLLLVDERGVDKLQALMKQRNSPFLSGEPERIIRATQALSKGRGKGGPTPLKDTAAATWGIQAINAAGVPLTGKGVKMAILDTGFDFTHPDFSGRTLHRKSFTGTRQAKDKEGHGTHCAGIAGGGRKGNDGARYGVAPGARLYIGKILDDAGEGTDGQALAGIEWALEKGCQIISMSFGAPVEEGQAFSEIFEHVAQTAMANKCLLMAAAGNESAREEGLVGPVNHPANCPSVMSVAGLTQTLGIGDYSCAGAGGSGGQVDIAAPGDNILSAKPGGKYQRQSGTSMATAFVAGAAALLWEGNPDAGAAEIWVRLTQQAKRLPLASVAVGAGLAYLR